MIWRLRRKIWRLQNMHWEPKANEGNGAYVVEQYSFLSAIDNCLAKIERFNMWLFTRS